MIIKRTKHSSTRIAYLSGTQTIRIEFPYNTTDLANVRTLDGPKWNPVAKFWSCPLSVENINKLQGWGFQLGFRLEQALSKSQVGLESLTEVEVPGLLKTLYPFQKVGVAALEYKNGRLLIGDEMGLGKTVQALAYLQLHPELRPAIVVAPKSAKLTWDAMAKEWMPEPNTQVLSGMLPERSVLNGDIFIINYNILPNAYEKNPGGKPTEIEYTGWVDYLRDLHPKVIIADEIQYISNSKAQRTKAFKKLCKGVPQLIGLSGTPIRNRPVEFYTALHLIEPSIVPTWWTYVYTFCDAKHNGFGWDFSGSSNENKLHDTVKSVMIRRLKKDVLTELPPKIKSVVPIELSNPADYRKIENEFIDWIRKTKSNKSSRKDTQTTALAQIEHMKQTAIIGKMKGIIEWIHDFLQSDEKLVCFATHRATIEILMKEFGKIAVKIDGSSTEAQRFHAVTSFQNDPNTRLLFGNIIAAGINITLTAARHAAILELPWSPVDALQAESRIHRITQTGTVNVYYHIGFGTIEEKIIKLLDKKRTVIDSVVDGEQTEKTSLLEEIIKAYDEEN